MLIKSKPTSLVINILIGVFFTVVLFLLIEGIFFVLIDKSPMARFDYIDGWENYMAVDDTLGVRLLPNRKATVKKYAPDNRVVYEVTYRTDEYGRRIVPQATTNAQNKYMLFFGGSYTLGMGVEEDKTTTFYVAEQMPDYRVYNYGCHGYGTQQMLAHLQREDFKAEINEETGIALYIFIGHHVNRVVGATDVYNAWGSHYPYYTLDANANVIRKGNFDTDRPISTLYSLLGESWTFDYFDLIVPKLEEPHFKLTAKIMVESRDTYQAKFGNDNFYIIFFPGALYTPNIIPYLEEASVNYLDFSVPVLPPEFIISGDTHPTGEAHKLFADDIVKGFRFYRPDLFE